MAWLSLLLFLPWFAVLGGLYWLFPRAPRPPARRRFDAIVLLLALVLSVAGMHWGYHEGWPGAALVRSGARCWRCSTPTALPGGAGGGHRAAHAPVRALDAAGLRGRPRAGAGRGEA
jgi:hypothetical protein